MQATASLQDSVDMNSDYAQTSEGWQSRNLMIVNKHQQLIPYTHNKAQLILANAKEQQRKAGFPVRIIIVKARQKGMSTGEAGSIFETINRRKNVHACLISMDVDGTDKVFRMTKTFQDNMPRDMRKPTDKSNRKMIAYKKPHNSSILCQTAGKEVLGRGGTSPLVHATEVAFWRNAERQLAGLLAEVPKTPESSVVIESTAFGTVGAFHDRYMAAIDRVKRGDFSGFIPLFVPWSIDDEYTMKIPRNVDMTLHTDHSAFGDEQRLFRRFGLTPEQLYWRRWMIENDFDNDLSWFMQEYPSTWREAFQGTGRMVFKPADLDYMETYCKDPVARVEFYRDEGTVKYKHVNRGNNCWSVWRWPTKNHSYVGFADVAEGLLSDQANPKSEPDRSVAAFMDRETHDVPVTYYGRPDTIEFGDQFWMACEYYGYPWASPEMNSIGQSVLDAGKKLDYPFIYNRENKEETDQAEPTLKLGWKTTKLTRKPMIADLEEVVKQRGLFVYDKRFIDEMRVFVVNKVGKEEAETSEHDDCVMCIAGLLQMHQRCPMNEDFSWSEQKTEQVPRIAVMGAVATEDPDDKDPNDILYSIEDFE